MPSTGTPASNTACGERGGFVSVTDSGPPDRMMPRAPKALTSPSAMSHGWISQYTPLSRTRRAISCVYWAPKSRIRMRCAWMSGGRATWMGSADTVVRRFLGDGHVVDVALAHTRVRDPDEFRPRAHLVDVGAAGVAHRGPQAAGELVQDRDDAALVRDAPLDALRHELFDLGRGVLEIAVARAVRLRHRTERAHAAIGLV